MSQSQNPKDSQALLQSMLQRLKLQPGREGQAYLHAPAASTWGRDGERGASNVQNVNNSPVNGFNGISSKEFAANFGLKGGETQQPGHDGGVISVPSQRDNIDGERGEDRVPEISPTGTGKLFPAQSRQDADITSFERTDGESFGSKSIKDNNNTATSMGQNQDIRSFTPKVYMWASKPSDANLDSHIGNGVFAAQSTDVQVVPTNNSLRRKQQRASESKTRRWTQKIKDRWRDRPGSFGKKGKEEERRVEQKSEGADISPQKQPLTPENLNASNKEENRTLPSVDTPSTHTEDGSNEGYMRSTGDFDFGLGSFSLLDEIVTGQEWAKFLNPNQSASSTIQRPTELTIPTNPPDSHQSSLKLNQHGDANSQWNFRGTNTPDSDFSMAQISPDAFQPVSMDVTEGKQAAVREVHSDQSEPMEHGHTRRPHSVKPTDILENSEMKRASLNRKRQHERLHTESISNGKGEGSRLSLSPTNNHMMEETGASQHDNRMPLYTLKSPPPPLSPFTPFTPAPRGVLKHSISQDSHMSTEIVSKRRRLEENRHVHFSEEVVNIEPLEPYPDATDSEEEDSEEEEDSVTEYEVVQVGIEEVAAPAGRRAALPAWIQALKRKNTGRKPR